MAKIPFDIKYRPQIESGEYKLITRQGGYAEILKWDLLGDRHILAVVETEYDESPFKYWPDGHIVSGINENYDLFIITPDPEMYRKNMNPIDYWYQKYLKEKLTWEDVKAICDIDMSLYPRGIELYSKEYYEKVLQEFNAQRKK